MSKTKPLLSGVTSCQFSPPHMFSWGPQLYFSCYFPPVTLRTMVNTQMYSLRRMQHLLPISPDHSGLYSVPWMNNYFSCIIDRVLLVFHKHNSCFQAPLPHLIAICSLLQLENTWICSLIVVAGGGSFNPVYFAFKKIGLMFSYSSLFALLISISDINYWQINTHLSLYHTSFLANIFCTHSSGRWLTQKAEENFWLIVLSL